MTVYIDLVILLNFLVDLLLLAGTNRLTGHPVTTGRCVAGGVLGGLYGGICVLPGFGFLGNVVWRSAALVGIGVTAFGVGRSAGRRCVLFVFLSMALGGFSLLSELRGFGGLLLAAAFLLMLCIFGLREKLGKRELVPVELEWKGRKRLLMALRDTGNGLTDPITGTGVLIVSREVAWELTGLSEAQLKDPVSAIGCDTVPGLRLLPCKTAASSGMMLALRMDRMVVDGQKTYGLAAFSPMSIGRDEGYEALTGG